MFLTIAFTSIFIIVGVVLLLLLYSVYSIKRYHRNREHYHLVRFMDLTSNNYKDYTDAYIHMDDYERKILDDKVDKDIEENGLTDSTLLIYRINLDRIIDEEHEEINEFLEKSGLKK